MSRIFVSGPQQKATLPLCATVGKDKFTFLYFSSMIKEDSESFLGSMSDPNFGLCERVRLRLRGHKKLIGTYAVDVRNNDAPTAW